MKRKRARRIISLLLTFVMVLSLSVSWTMATGEGVLTEEIDLSQMYRKYDLKTGEVSLVPRYAPPQYRDGQRITATEPFNPVAEKEVLGDRSIIGTDGRTQVTSTTSSPYYRIAKLVMTYTDGTSAEGTGFMVSGNVLLTAGHCCMSTSNASLSSMTVYLGRNETYTPITASVSYYYVCANFTYFNDDDKDDYAIVVLSTSPGNTTGWFGLGYQNDSFFLNNTFTITGYPGDKTYGTMWKASGSVNSCATYVLNHSIDTYAGESGAPLYSSSNVVYGIQVSGVNPSSQYNHCRRMTQEVVDWLIAQGLIS